MSAEALFHSYMGAMLLCIFATPAEVVLLN